MRIAEGLVELIAHTRWLCSHALSFIDPQVQEEYVDAFALAQLALEALSKPMTDVERLSEVPSEAFGVLCDGIMYLLVAEAILGQSPSTMHTFLRQSAASGGRPDRQQVHLIMARWLAGSGVIDVNELELVIFGPQGGQQQSSFDDGSRPMTDATRTSVASYPGMVSIEGTPDSERYPTHEGTPAPLFESTLQLHGAIAEHLAATEPFFLGAHITILRGLVVRYSEEVVTVDDIMGHVRLLQPMAENAAHARPEGPTPSSGEAGGPAAAAAAGSNAAAAAGVPSPVITDPKVIDDALLAWIHAILSLVNLNLAGQAATSPHPPGSAGSMASPTARSAGGASSSAAAGNTPGNVFDISAMNDLYLHTNDGRALALLLHHYSASRMPLSSIHLHQPLTVWQRQDNWSSIIRAAEELDLWVGVFPAEFVAHGFQTLQHHVLRFTAELFVMLAAEAENEYVRFSQQMTMSEQELDASTQFVNVTASAVSVPAQLRRSQLVLRASFAAVEDGAPMTPADPAAAAAAAGDESHQQQRGPAADNNSPTPRSKFASVPVAGGAVDTRTFPVKGTPEAERVHASLDDTSEASPAYPGAPDPAAGAALLQAQRNEVVESTQSSVIGASFPVSRSGPTSAVPGVSPRPPAGADDEAAAAAAAEEDEEEGGDDYCVVLTSMVINGLAMQLHSAAPPPEQPAGTAESVVVSELPPAQPHDEAALPSALSPERRADPPQRDDNPALASMGSVSPEGAVEGPPRSKSPEISGRRKSVASAQESVRASFADLHLGRVAGVPTNPLVKSVSHFRAQRIDVEDDGVVQAKPTGNVRGRVGGVARSLVQGSVDAEGIEDLFNELSELGPSGAKGSSKATVPKGLPQDDLLLQNQALRQALRRQQEQVRAIVDRLRRKMPMHELDVVLRHQKLFGKAAAATPPAEPSPAAVSDGANEKPAAVSKEPAPLAAADMSSLTPALNVLALLAATERADPDAYARIPVPPTPERPPPAPQVDPSPPPPQASQPAPAVAAAPAPVPASAPSSQQPAETLAAAGPSAAPSTAPDDARSRRGYAFDVPLGSSVGVKGAAGPQLSSVQLAKLKQRHADRRGGAGARPAAAGAVRPGRLPTMAAGGDDAGNATPSSAAESLPMESSTSGPPRVAGIVRSRSNPHAAAAKSTRNNKQHVVNALRHVCLPGAINKPQLDAAVQIVEDEPDATHFVVLLKDEYNKQFKGLYMHRVGSDNIQRVFGAGPLAIRVMPDAESLGIDSEAGAKPNGAPPPNQPSRLFKFDTGGKKFSQLPSPFFNQMTDAVTLPPKLRNTRPPL